MLIKLLLTPAFILLSLFASPMKLPGIQPAATAAGNADEKTDELLATRWLWKSYMSADQTTVNIENPDRYVLQFNSDGSLNITADCNRVVAGYKFTVPNISITPGPATLAACPPGSKGDQFVDLLGRADQIFVRGMMLIVILKDKGTLTFSAPTLVDRCGKNAVSINALDNGLDPATTDQLDKVLVGFVESGTRPAPGASLLVITPAGRYFKSVGVADISTCEPLKADSNYQIGSNTKMMTSSIIYQLQESGRLRTSDRLSRWLPDLAARLPGGNEITIEMLLTHTSGLSDYFEIETEGGKISSGTQNREILTRTFTPVELVEIVAADGKQLFKPGEKGKWAYSNTGYILLGLIIEKTTGRPYEENLRERIFKPLGLKTAYLQRGGPVAGSLPQSFYMPPFTFSTRDWNASQGWSAGAVVMTSTDFSVFLKALFTGKLFRIKRTLDLMLGIPAAGIGVLGEGTKYGHGMLENKGVLGHGGETLGFQSDGGYIPGKDVTIVMWANSAQNNVNRLTVPIIAGIVTGDRK